MSFRNFGNRRDFLRAAGAAGLVARVSAQQAVPERAIVQRDPLFRLPVLDDYLLTRHERNLPGVRRWDFGLNGGIDHFGTTESVGDGAGSRFLFRAADMEAAGGPGRVFNQDSAAWGALLTDFAGVSFWAKGDGSSAMGKFGWGFNGRKHFLFPLSHTDWRKYFVRWEDFEPPIDGPTRYPGYSLENPEPGRDHHYVLDRLRLFRDEVVEPIQPTPRQDLPGKVPANRFIERRDALQRTLRQLNGEAVGGRRRRRGPGVGPTIVIVGDSILDGAQLHYVYGGRITGEDNNRQRRREFAFPSLAAEAVAQTYGFANPNIAHYSYEKDGWKKYFGEEAGAGLNWISVGLSGFPTSGALMHLDYILDFEPDLLIYNLGANDVRMQRSIQWFYRPNISKVVEAARARKIEVALCTPITTGDVAGSGQDKLDFSKSAYARSFIFADEMRELAAKFDAALVDFQAAYRARGIHAVGELCSDAVHANAQGHRLMANCVIELLTGRGGLIWERGAG